jgi:hypothetical protein
MLNIRKERDNHRVVELPADKLWGDQTQRSLDSRRSKATAKARCPREARRYETTSRAIRGGDAGATKGGSKLRG